MDSDVTLREIKRQWFNAESEKGHLPKVVDSAEASGIRDTVTTAWSPSKVCEGPSFAGHPGHESHFPVFSGFGQGAHSVCGRGGS